MRCHCEEGFSPPKQSPDKQEIAHRTASALRCKCRAKVHRPRNDTCDKLPANLCENGESTWLSLKPMQSKLPV
jgi:hypothetical protein